MAGARLEVGRIVKAHGLGGEVIVQLSTDRLERLTPGSVLWAGERRLEVRASRPHTGRFLVTFAGLASREAADAVRGAVLSAEALEDPGTLWVHELIGSAVATPDGTDLGRVVAVEANPASDLLVLDGGGLVPLTFVTGTSPGRVVVDPPPGLLG